MNELYRVLKSDGQLIVSFPICIDKNTYSSPDINSDELRWRYYGQSDHVRLFGKDYKEILSKYGWKIREYSPSKLCNKDDIRKYGFLYNDIIMIAEKRIIL